MIIANKHQLAAAMQQAATAYSRGEWAAAEQLCRQILTARADYFDALNMLGIIAAQTQRAEEAASLLGRAVAAKPADAAAHNNHGHVLNNLKRFEAALDSYARALEINPGYANAYYNRGNTLLELKRFEEALGSYACALKIKPDYAEAYNNCAVALQELRRFEDALDCHARALQINPNHAEAYNNAGLTLHELQRFEEALDCYARALQLRPDYAQAHNNRGNTLLELKRFEEALDSYACALKIDADCDWSFGMWLHAKLRLCDWTSLDSRIADLAARIRQAKKTSPPFQVLGLIDCLSLQRHAAETWVSHRFPESRVLPPLGERAHHEPRPPHHPPGLGANRARHGKIRVGYFSGDFCDHHPVATLTAGMFEAHDRECFAVTGFSFGPQTDALMRRRLEGAFDRFVDVRNRTDRQVAQLARQLELDIAVDLGGFTDGGRPGILALRAAPIQVNYLGYPGTLAAPYIDYIVADRVVVPAAARCAYTEKVAYLPHCYLPGGDQTAAGRCQQSRSDCGLPPEGFVFCCFNVHYKITPDTFDSWMRILRATAGSVLWLKMGGDTTVQSLRQEAARRGIAPERIVFAPQLPGLEAHLARHSLADLFLDTLPYNAHTTARDALWAGLPVLTCAGEAFAARVGASLLTAVGLPELITTTREGYEALAVQLAHDAQKLAAIRQRLVLQRATAPLFDLAAFTRHLEGAYIQMYDRYLAGAAPEHFHVEPQP